MGKRRIVAVLSLHECNNPGLTSYESNSVISVLRFSLGASQFQVTERKRSFFPAENERVKLEKARPDSVEEKQT